MGKILTKAEFIAALSKVPGVRIEGDKVIGLRLLTPEERLERQKRRVSALEAEIDAVNMGNFRS